MSDQPRQTRRPRIDSVLNSINAGTYDDRLIEIRNAVNERLQSKRDEVLALVQEVFGEGYTVTTGKNPSQQQWSEPIESAAPRSSNSDQDAAPGQDLVPIEDVEDEKDMESRSPIIGPHNPT